MFGDNYRAPGYEIANATATSGKVGSADDPTKGLDDCSLSPMGLRHQVCPRSAASRKIPMNFEQKVAVVTGLPRSIGATPVKAFVRVAPTSPYG
jgi:hypothetical protein